MASSSPSSSSTANTSNTEISLSTSFEADQIKYNEPRDMFCMSSIKAPEFESEDSESRSPLDIICVIDKSGSMAGSKLDLVKKTLEFMVDQLKPQDRISLVTFDTDVALDLDLTTMSEKGKNLSKSVISKVRAGSCTNLSGGIFKGFEVVKQRQVKNEVVSILVFTDGIANVGLTNSSQLVSAVENIMSDLGTACSLFTFGFGKDHDSNMLKSIAEAGNGLYYFIEKQDEIPESFANCLGGLCSVVAQNIALKVSITDTHDKVSIKNVKTNFKHNFTKPNKELTITLGDLYSEENRDIILELSFSPLNAAVPESDIIKFELTYFNVITSKLCSTTSVGSIKRVDQIQGKLVMNVALDKQRNRLINVNALEKARQFGDANKLEEAKTVIDEAIAKIQKSPSAEDMYCKGLVQDLIDCKNTLENRNTYMSVGSKMMSNFHHGNAYQRNVSSKSSAQRAYMNKSKAKKIFDSKNMM